MATFNGEIEEVFEVDQYDVHLRAGRKYYIEAEGADTSAGTLREPVVSLYQGSTRLAFDIDGGVGLNGRLVYTPVVSGVYTLQVLSLIHI